ncbi:MAG: hypothetical protein KDD55_03950 [Bdellovibrionales bacterium]|nr:hypothetical protein [Bdellovibrionales bacterium]
MSRAFTPGLHVTSSTRIRRRRELPLLGEVLVTMGENVPVGVDVARGELPGELYVLRLPERMGLEVFEVLGGLKKKVGDRVEKGELLCEHAGLFGLLKTRYAAPDTGVIEFITEKSGHVALRLPSTPISVDSFMGGQVVEIEEGKSVVLETDAAFIQGIFGVGGERAGTIHMLEIEPDKEITPADLPSELKGAILVGGARPQLETLHAAASSGAVGLVTGSIDDRVLAKYLGYDLGIALTGDEDVPLSVILTEGFGSMRMSRRSLEVFSKHDGATAVMNGMTQVRAGAVRPEVIIPREMESGQPMVDEKQLTGGLGIGSGIRIIRVPYFGQCAVVTKLPKEEYQIETGAFTRVLHAKLESTKEEVIVPRANVELL